MTPRFEVVPHFGEHIVLAFFGEAFAGLCKVSQVDRVAPRGYVHDFSVLEAWRGRGVGAALLEEAIRQGGRYLFIRSDNADGRRLFERGGFTPIDRYPHPSGEYDVVYMRLVDPLPAAAAADRILEHV